MTDAEQTELDIWIAEHVMGLKPCVDPDGFTADEQSTFYLHKGRCLVSSTYRVKYAPEATPFGQAWRKFSPTTNSADAFEVQKQCLEKLERIDKRLMTWRDGKFWCVRVDNEVIARETLEVTICVFAEHLFSGGVS